MGVKYKKGEHGLERAKFECDVCGKIDFWGKGWAFFGSDAQLERGEKVPTVCSVDCMFKYDEQKAAS